MDGKKSNKYERFGSEGETITSSEPINIDVNLNASKCAQNCDQHPVPPTGEVGSTNKHKSVDSEGSKEPLNFESTASPSDGDNKSSHENKQTSSADDVNKE